MNMTYVSALVLALCLLVSGCYQSKRVDKPFEELVDYFSIAYGANLRVESKGVLYPFKGDGVISLDHESRTRELAHIIDAHESLGIDQSQFFIAIPKRIEVVDYQAGKRLHIKMKAKFIANIHEHIIIKAHDAESTMVSVDAYSRFFIFCSMMRDHERKWLDKISKDVELQQVTRRYTKYKSVAYIRAAMQRFVENAAFLENIKNSEPGAYDKVMRIFTNAKPINLSIPSVVSAVDVQADLSIGIMLKISTGKSEGIERGMKLIIYRDTSYIVSGQIEEVHEKYSMCSVKDLSWNEIGLKVEAMDSAMVFRPTAQTEK